MPIPHMSDTINLSDVHAGTANAGNGATGYNEGTINYNPTATLSAAQVVTGAAVDLHNGDHLMQSADWGAGTAGHGGSTEAANGLLSDITNNGAGGAGGNANSNGDLGSMSGGDVAAAHADTTATQYTEFLANQGATILAGVGGNGGSGNLAEGGSVSTALVHTDPITTTTTATATIDHAFVDLDLSHLPV